MDPKLFSQLTNLLSFFAVGTTFLLIVRENLNAQVRVFALQSFILALLACTVALYASSPELFGVAIALFVLKGLVIPRVLNRAVRNLGISPSSSPYLGTTVSLVVCGALVIVAIYALGPIAATDPLPTAGAIPLALAGVLIGLFITVNRRRALTQILGFLMLENSIFLFALLLSYGVPFIVELGVFLDVLVAVLIMEVFLYRIKENFDSIDVGQMGELKG